MSSASESDTTSGLASNPTVGKVVERVVGLSGAVLFGETTELTGAEHIVAERFTDSQERHKFQDMFDEYARFVDEQDADLLGSQPTEGQH